MSESEVLIELGLRIKKLRSDKGMKQTHLAAECDFEKATMSKIEAGKVNVSYLTLHRIAGALKMPIRELVED